MCNYCVGIAMYDRSSYQMKMAPPGDKSMEEGKNKIYRVIIIIDKEWFV